MRLPIKRLTQSLTALAFVAAIGLSVSHVKAAAAGQIAGGNHIYTIANLTKGTDFANPQSADACDQLEYRLRLYNPGPSGLSDVKVEVSINTMTKYTSAVSTATIYAPDGQPNTVAAQATLNISTPQTQSFVPGSAVLLNSAGGVIKSLGDITAGGGGVSVGPIGASVTEYVKFKTKVSCPETPPPPAQPTYKCEALDLSADDRTAKITVFTTSQSNGATFKNAVINWGDGSDNLTTTDVVGKTHTYDKAGTYTVSTTAHFTVNGQDVTSNGPACSKSITFSEKPNVPPTVTVVNTTTTPPASTTTTVTGAAPTTLVNTGPGELAALFTGTSLLGAFGYRRLLSRRLGA